MESTRVLRRLSFGVARDTVTVLLGHRDAGKTTCLRHIVGLSAPDEGDVIVDGQSVPRLRGRRLASHRRRCGLLFQGHDRGLFAAHSVFDNVAWPLRIAHVGEREVRARTLQVLHDADVVAYADARPAELGPGPCKRVALARALVTDPDVVLLDDLDAGVDGDDLCELLRRRREAVGGTYLVTTRDEATAGLLGDAVIPLAHGRIDYTA